MAVIACRPLADGDRAAVARLDASYVTSAEWEVRPTGAGFALSKRPLSAPRTRRHVVDVDELNRAHRAVVAERDGVVIGVAALAVHEWNRRAVVSHLYVDRASRGIGAGRALLEELVTCATAIGARCLWVETQNANVGAIAFYERCGFERCGLDTTLYDPRQSPGDVALYLARQLVATPERPGAGRAETTRARP
jgi:ribosomal protein S18 acetylase RimI-like enzyme